MCTCVVIETVVTIIAMHGCCVFCILQLALFRQLPSRLLSRTWGRLTSKELPKWSRRPVLGLYVWAFGCDMEEALIEDIREYPSLSKLFTRQLKEDARVVSSDCLVVSSSVLVCDKSL